MSKNETSPEEDSIPKYKQSNLLTRSNIFLIAVLFIISSIYFLFTYPDATFETPVVRHNEVATEEPEDLNYKTSIAIADSYVPIFEGNIPFLPNYKIDFPETWKVEYLSFFLDYDKRFSADYSFSSNNEGAFCDGGSCQTVRLSKDDIDIDLKFLRISGMHGVYCSNTAEVIQLENGWWRLADRRGYLYVKDNIFFNASIPIDYMYEGDVVIDEDWEKILGKDYKVCYFGSGIEVKDRPPFHIENDGAVILLYPRINSNNEQHIDEIDIMLVKSGEYVGYSDLIEDFKKSFDAN